MRVALKSPKVWCALHIAMGYLLLPQILPRRVEEKRTWTPKGWNWFGQPGWVALLYAGGLLILLCALRFLIIQRTRRAIDAVAWYCLALAVFVPATWLSVVTDWDNQAVAEIGCWVGVPIALLFVPSVLFAFYLFVRPSLTLGVYTLLSMIEITLLVPAWAIFWVYVELLILGWVGV